MFDQIVLQTGSTSPFRRAPGRNAVVVLMLGLWLGLAGLSTSEHLHQLVHSDSQHVNHECLLTLFAKSHLFHSATPLKAAVARSMGFDLPPLANCTFHPVADIRLAPGRAPPVVSRLHQ
jgi:hypothetical protein